MKQFEWKINHVEQAQGTMLVEYTYNGSSMVYNLPVPPADQDIAEWVKMYAPVSEWERSEAQLAAVEVGMTGSHVIISPTAGVAPASEVPSLSGSLNEEYIRAVVYSVLEEMREAQV